MTTPEISDPVAVFGRELSEVVALMRRRDDNGDTFGADVAKLRLEGLESVIMTTDARSLEGAAYQVMLALSEFEQVKEGTAENGADAAAIKIRAACASAVRVLMREAGIDADNEAFDYHMGGVLNGSGKSDTNTETESESESKTAPSPQAISPTFGENITPSAEGSSDWM